MQLSRKRADVVRAGLIARGVAPRDVEARAYGEAYPAASNATEEGRRRNDRVELVLVPPGQSGEASYRETYEASAGDLIPY
jgi:outer membrane protein OmpA-like peptidoglycan-associated protein